MAATRCSNCHRLLTDSASIAMGVGPECRGKLAKSGWKFPKPVYQVRHGKVELVRMVGKLEKPDEKREIVRRVLQEGGTPLQARDMLRDYMAEKESPMTLKWCEWFVRKTMQEMSDE